MIIGVIASQIPATPPSPPPVTSSPSIEDYYCYTDMNNIVNIMWAVRNDDASTATIYTEVNNSNPSRYTATLNSGALSGNFSQGGYSLGGSVTVYAKAKANGKDLSSYTAQTVNKKFCYSDGGF